MGFVSGLLGTAGGAGGTGFSGPESANLLNPVTQQMGTDALKQQQDLINAYQPGGTAALASQQDLLSQLGQASQGGGPNPALAQLAQSTAANTANQAALQAGQRGAAMNPALIARQASMQGAQNQQNMAGQAATLSAQQQIAARQALANQQAQMIGQQQGQTNTYAQNVAGQTQAQNQANLGNQQSINQINGQLAGNVQQNQGKILGGAAQGAAAGFMAGLAKGGQVDHLPVMNEYNLDEGGQIPITKLADGGNVGPRSSFGKYIASNGKPIPQAMPVMAGGPGSIPMAEGGKVPAMVSPGERYLSPQDVQRVKEGANPMTEGKKIPGKPKVGGAKNDYANDTVKATLDEGGIVLPRSVTQSKHPHWEAHKFVSAIMAKNKGRLK